MKERKRGERAKKDERNRTTGDIKKQWEGEVRGS